MTNNKLDRDDERRPQNKTRGRTARRVTALTGAAVLVMALAAASPALASDGNSAHHPARPDYSGAIDFIVVTPGPYDVAGVGGVFNVDVAAVAQNATGNKWLSAAKGYKPGINTHPAIGHPDAFAPGLVVLLSTTPKAVGGPDANLAGLFQLTDVAKSSSGYAELIADWEVGKAGAFGKGTKTTLTAFLVSGTAPGKVTGYVKPISNVVKETFTIGK
jgi:hypothetical protein